MKPVRTLSHTDFSVAELAAAKLETYVSVCLPAKDEAATIGPIVSTVRDELVDSSRLVDEIVVVDDGSNDDTRRVAADAGARVIAAAEVLPEYGSGGGKGDALWKAVYASKGDVIVFCDADVRGFTEDFVLGLLGPLLMDAGVGFVKGFYRRPLGDDGAGGGRVTELVARPLMAVLFPELDVVRQPLAGEFAARREVLEQVPFAPDYGVDIALLIDIARRFGPNKMAQVDLGSRTHRNRPLDELAPQARAVIRSMLQRTGMDLAGDEARGTTVEDRPPLVDVAAYRHRF